MKPLYNGGRINASYGAHAWFKKMGAGWDPDKLDGVAMVAEQLAAKREGMPEFADLPVLILTRDVIKAFQERMEIDEEAELEQAFLNAVDVSAYSLGDDGTMNVVLIENNTGEEEVFCDRESALSYLLECGPIDTIAAAAGEMNRVEDEENEERDYRQALDNLVEDPNCDYYLGMRDVNGRVQVVNKHTQVGLWFDDDAQAADHILGEESQAQTLKAESQNVSVCVRIAEVQSDHQLTDAQNEALTYARRFIGEED